MISKEEIQHLAVLARLELTDGEVESLQKDISNIVDYIGQVSAVSVEGSAPEAGLVRNVLRSDTPRTEDDLLSDKRDALLAALPKREGDYNVVRKIIQKDA
jgi:aspartyl-tRNA(Asn)/glutamyl-tRNA(Gln) amidotransferase subunit C